MTLLSRRNDLAPPPTPPSPHTGPPRIADLEWRQRATAVGRIRSVRVQPLAGIPTLQCTLVDESGGLLVVFFGRRRIAGIQPGTRMIVEGMVGAHDRHLAMLNPRYELLPRS